MARKVPLIKGAGAPKLIRTPQAGDTFYFPAVVEMNHDLSFDIGSGEGIKIGSAFGWRDITGQIRQRGLGANDPDWSQIGATAFSAWKFAVNDQVWIEYHVPHDYVPGTDIFVHAHWLADGTNANPVKWEWTISHAAGFGQEAFNLGSPVTHTAAEASSAQYAHMVTETAAITLTDLEVDGMIYVRCRRITNGATENSDGIFLITSDVHYQSHNLATKNKAPNFYA